MYTDFFWDSENLNTDILQKIQELDKSDKLYIFYSTKSSKVDLNLVQKIRSAKCYIEFIECENGTPNAMDFRIVSFMGLKIGGYKHKYNKHRYIILSGDTGYDSAIAYFQNKNICVERWIDLFEEDSIAKKTKLEEEKKKRLELEKQKKEEETKQTQNEKMYDTIIRDCIARSTDLSNFHALLQKNTNAYIKKHCTTIYHQYKSQYKQLKNNAKN